MARLKTSQQILLSLGLLAVSSCSLGTKQSAGIRMVDNLVTHIETVQLESEVSRQVIFETLTSLHPLVARSFDGQVVETYTTFAIAVERSEDQAANLAQAIKPMVQAAERVFGRWEANLGQYSRESMRQRSQDRLDQARARYAEVLASALEVQAGYDEFNGGMRDLTLYLGIDLNPASVASIQGEAQELAGEGQDLRRDFEECSRVAQVYIVAAAPLGQLDVEVQPKSKP